MGFRPEPTIYNLSFQGTPLDGLHVRMSCCSLGEYNEMLRAAAAGDGEADEDRVKLTMDLIRNNERILELFVNHLVSWDLEDMAGQPVPTTREGIDTQERTIIAQCIMAWQFAMVNVPNLSKPGSNDGAISEEQSLGLGNVSESPQS